MKISNYLMLIGLSLIAACGNPTPPSPPPPPPVPPTVTLTASQLNPVFNSSVTFTATAAPADKVAKLELLEGTTVLKTVDNVAILEQSVLMTVAGNRSFTARVTDSAGVVATSAVVQVIVNLAATAVQQVAMGGLYTCALMGNSDVRCWGKNDFGQLGLGNTNSLGDDEAITSVPSIKFPTGFKVKQIAASFRHTCALSEEGKVICWGDNQFGQLGYGDTTNRGGTPDSTPDKLGFVDLPVVKTIVSGNTASHTCAVLVSGLVKCWGANDRGQLGIENKNNIGDAPNEIEPTLALDLGVSPIKQLAVGTSHNCALLEDSTLRCWGEGFFGQLGYGNINNFGDDAGETPNTKQVDIADATQISLGSSHTCVVTINKKVRCWGRNNAGQLGYGNFTKIGDDELPVTAGFVNVGADAQQISLGFTRSCVLLENNSIKCWGDGNGGQLGYGNTTDIGDDELPTAVGTVEVNTDITQGKVTQIFSGADHNCILFESGNIKCWGFNAFGQLGYGNTNNIGDNELPSSIGVVPLF
jgi:alpha-tubulin suppressor-like RCC1 family protein